MTVVVESKRVKVTKALRSFIEQQAQKLDKVSPRTTKVRVFLETIAKKHNDPSANIVTYAISVPGRKVMVVRRKAVDMYEAIVDASQEALRHLRKSTEKQRGKRRQFHSLKASGRRQLVRLIASER